MSKSTPTPEFDSIEALKKYLFVGLPSARKALFSGGDGFGRSRCFYDFMGNPQDTPKTVHLAGTSGKGSTAYYLSSLLIEHGFSVGTHVSPHVYDVRESALINLKCPSEPDYLKSFNKISESIIKMNSTDWGLPTYFEVLLGVSFRLFADKKVDYSVIETGLGGRFDSTNTITGPDKISAITRLGLDHTDVLGDTIAEIAYQKAGIINKDSLAMSVLQEESALRVIKQEAKKQNASLEIVDTKAKVKNLKVEAGKVCFDFDDGDFKVTGCKLNGPALYQAENASYAISILSRIAKRDNFELSAKKIKVALAKTFIPARLETKIFAGKTFILDGAHNPQKVRTFLDSLKKLELKEPPIFIVGLKQNKDLQGIIEQIVPMSDKVIFTEFFRNSDNSFLRKFASDSEILAQIAKEIDSSKEVFAEKSPKKAVSMALKFSKKDQPIVITGSLYLLSEINQFI